MMTIAADPWLRSTATGHTPIGDRMLMLLASYFLGESDFD